MLQFYYKKLKDMVFGAKSEKSHPVENQNPGNGKVVSMFDALTDQQLTDDYVSIVEAREEEVQSIVEGSSHTIRKPRKKVVCKPTGRKDFPESLPRKTTVINPEGIDLSNATLIGYDKTETLNFTPPKIWVDATIRNKYIIKEETTGVKKFHQAPAV